MFDTRSEFCKFESVFSSRMGVIEDEKWLIGCCHLFSRFLGATEKLIFYRSYPEVWNEKD